MRSVFPFVALIAFAICPSVKSDDITIAKARAKAALDLAVRQRERDDIAAAKAKAADALRHCAKCRAESEGCMTDLSAASTKASKESKPLFVWVGMTCDDKVRKAFPDAIHVHVDAMNGGSFPRLVVQRPGSAETWRFLKEDIGAPIIAPVREWLTARPQQKVSAWLPVSSVVCVT